MYYHLYLDIETREEDEEQIIAQIVEVILRDLVYINESVKDKKNETTFMTRNGLISVNKMISNYIKYGIGLALEEIIKASIVYKKKHLIEQYFIDLYVNLEKLLIRGTKIVKLQEIQKMIQLRVK